MKTRLILVGGFLGAGKTTLLWEAAQRLASRGLRVGLVTNDQAPELVDTAFLARGGLKIEEVNGSCFCCNFQGLLDAVSKVRRAADADVIIAEPVGSCTDLSATIIQPLKEHLRQELVVAPLSVMADPLRLEDILEGGTADLHPSAAYIFRKQLEEADIAVISKADLLKPAEIAALRSQVASTYPKPGVCCVSAKTGAGLDAWLDEVMCRSDAGQRIVDVDYDIYAEGEAVLGWLNATMKLQGGLTQWEPFIRNFLSGLSHDFDRMGAPVGHVKVMIESGTSFVIANLTGKGETLCIRGKVADSGEARLTVNARVQMAPEELEKIVRGGLTTVSGGRLGVSMLAWRCLSPGRPNPTHRYGKVFAGLDT